LAFGIKNHKKVNAMAGLKPTEEQLAYASLLDLGRKIGFIGLVITFISLSTFFNFFLLTFHQTSFFLT